MKRDLSPITPHCGFDVPTWLDHLRAIDEHIFHEIKKTHENTEAWDRSLLETWLRQCHPEAHTAVRGMENAWRNCATTAFHQVVFLLEMYDHISQNDDRGGEMIQPEEETPRVEHTPLEEESEGETDQKPAYREKGEWGSHLVGKNLTLYRNPANASQLLRHKSYRTYYSVNGLWDMENLLSYFDRNEIQALGVKDKGIPAEMEMLRFRVVTQEPYAPDHIEKKRVVKKKKL